MVISQGQLYYEMGVPIFFSRRGGGQTIISTFARLGCQWILAQEICAPFQIPSDPTVKVQNMIYLTSMLERFFFCFDTLILNSTGKKEKHQQSL